jgi:uncharacterized membrane protein
MELMILGLILFLGTHSLRIYSEPLRSSLIEKFGIGTFKVVYALLSLLGILFIVNGHDEALQIITWGWDPPIFTKHINILFMLIASVMLISAYIPNNHIKGYLKHPMILSVKVWALAHLIANGEGANIILFGSILIWSVLNFRAARKRDRIQMQTHSDSHPMSTALNKEYSLVSTLICIISGAVIWCIMLGYLHNILFGVYPIIIPGFIGPAVLPVSAG